MEQERKIFSIIKEDKIIADFTESEKNKKWIKELKEKESATIIDRMVDEEFYQELVEEAGSFKYI